MKPGQQSYYKQKTKTVDDERWNGVWEVSADLDGHRKPFPIPRVKTPDIVIWCMENKTVQLAELTVPHVMRTTSNWLRIVKTNDMPNFWINARKQVGVQNTFLLE